METQTQPATTENKPKFVPITEAQLAGGFFTELVNVDPNGDAFALAPPIPDNEYIARLIPSRDPEHPTLESITWPEKMVDGVLKPEATIIKVNFNFLVESFLDPAADNTILKGKNLRFDEEVTSKVKLRDGLATSGTTTLLKYLGYATPAGSKAIDVALMLKQLIESGEARLKVKTRWKAAWQQGTRDDAGKYTYGKWRVSGQTNFPLISIGKYSPKITVDGEEFTARAQVVEFGPITK